MFEMSFGKLLLLAVIVVVVWYGFKRAARVETMRRNVRAEAQRRRNRGGNIGSARGAQSVEDLVKCRQCGAFVAASGAANCGKPSCPWGV